MALLLCNSTADNTLMMRSSCLLFITHFFKFLFHFCHSGTICCLRRVSSVSSLPLWHYLGDPERSGSTIVWPSGWFAGCSSGWCSPLEWWSSPHVVPLGGASRVQINNLVAEKAVFVFRAGWKISHWLSFLCLCWAALTYHYETQCIPTPLAWFAHQLPVWWQKLSVVGAFVLEIPVPLLFFSPWRRLRLGAFYMQVRG